MSDLFGNYIVGFLLSLSDPHRTQPRSCEVQQPHDGAWYTHRLSRSEKTTQTNQSPGLGPGKRCKTKAHSTFKKVSLKYLVTIVKNKDKDHQSAFFFSKEKLE